MTARAGELTRVYNRNWFDAVPDDVTKSADIVRWLNFRKAYAAAAEHSPPADFPLQVDIELTSQCNMTCKFCTHGQINVPKQVLSFRHFCMIIDEGKRHGLVSIKLNYINEPLLVPDLERYIAYAKSQGVLNVYFATNGLLLDEDYAQRLIGAGLTKLMVSLDAFSAETFKAIRGNGAFHRVTNNILQFIQIRNEAGLRFPLVRVNFLRTSLNWHEYDQFLGYWGPIADMVGFQEQVALPLDFEGEARPPRRAQETAEKFRCTFPSKQLVVDAWGQILPCCTFSGRLMPMGNIKSTTLAEVWQGRQMKHLRGVHKQRKITSNPVCANCVGCQHD